MTGSFSRVFASIGGFFTVRHSGAAHAKRAGGGSCVSLIELGGILPNLRNFGAAAGRPDYQAISDS